MKFEKLEGWLNFMKVSVDEKFVGTAKPFCCGTDFVPAHKPKAMFSIMGYKGEKELIACIEAILKLDIPDIDFHWDFRPRDIEGDKYQESLTGIK